MCVCVCARARARACVCVWFGVIYVYVDTAFEVYVLFFSDCSVECLSMIIWTSAVLSVLYACAFVFLYLTLFSAIEHVSHGKAL